MILVDTGPLVALSEPRDALNARALAELDRMRSQTLLTCLPVLSEACFHLPAQSQRLRLRRWMMELSIAPPNAGDEVLLWRQVFEWMEKYADQEPDFADAWLVVLCETDKRFKVWTFDREFSAVWRRPDGSRIPMAV